MFLDIWEISTSAVLTASLTKSRDVDLTTASPFLAGFQVGVLCSFSTAGWIVRRLPCRIVLFFRVVFHGALGLLIPFSGAVWAMAVLRARQGVALGTAGVAARAFVVCCVPKDRLGTVMGYVAFPAMLGPVIGPAAAAILLNRGWARWYFFLIFSFSFALGAALLKKIPDNVIKKATNLL